MLDSALLSHVARILIVLMVPLTAIVVFVSVLGGGMLSFFKLRDEAALYTIRLIGIIVASILLSTVLSRFLIEETRAILLL